MADANNPPPPQGAGPNQGPAAPDLAQAIQALVAVTQQLANNAANQQQGAQGGNQGGNQAQADQPVIDLFSSTLPHDQSTRHGQAAYNKVIEPPKHKLSLNDPMSIVKFKSEAQLHARDVNWGSAAPQGILTYVENGVTYNILEEPEKISMATLVATLANNQDPRYLQDRKGMYHYVLAGLDDDLRSLIFDQPGNLPAVNDGPILFKLAMGFTSAATLQQSLNAQTELWNYDPSKHDFDLAKVHKDLANLFALMRTQHRNPSEHERGHFALAIYKKIKQPARFVHGVIGIEDRFTRGEIASCQDMMNEVLALQQRLMLEQDGKFNGSLSSAEDDVIAMIATLNKQKQRQPTRPGTGTGTGTNPTGNGDRNDPNWRPPFINHYFHGNRDTGKYKAGDTKKDQFDRLWYFCPIKHRNGERWHLHRHTECSQFKSAEALKASQAQAAAAAAAAAAASADDEVPAGDATSDGSSTDASAFSALTHDSLEKLALMYNAAPNGPGKEALADALHHLKDAM